jgi:glutamate---cysteine ligase / carboxylate-amine ligase
VIRSRASTLALIDPRLAFDAHACDVPTIGAEEELFLVDRDGNLAPVAETVQSRLGDDRRFALEFRAAQIETISPVCVTAVDLERELVAARASLADAARGLALPVAVPVHPTAATPAPMTARERYEAIATKAPWAARELETCGMHVHIGLRGADRSLAVYNALRSYLPLLAALSASSPFHRGGDAGVASVRSRVNATLPRWGVPPGFARWEDFEGFVRWGAHDGVIPDPSFHWYDARLNIACGTVEVRVFDVQADAASAAALAALTQALAGWLAQRHDRGESLPVHPSHRIQECVALATRDGTSGRLPDLETGELVPTVELVGRLLDDVAPVADELGSSVLLERIPGLAAVCGAERQRLVVAGRGLPGLIPWLVDQTTRPHATALIA